MDSETYKFVEELVKLTSDEQFEELDKLSDKELLDLFIRLFSSLRPFLSKGEIKEITETLEKNGLGEVAYYVIES